MKMWFAIIMGSVLVLGLPAGVPAQEVGIEEQAPLGTPCGLQTQGPGSKAQKSGPGMPGDCPCGMTGECPMMKMMGGMRQGTLAVDRDGVYVLIGSTLYKFDKNLNLKKEYQLKSDQESMPGRRKGCPFQEQPAQPLPPESEPIPLPGPGAALKR